MVGDAIIWVGGNVVQQLVDCFGRVLGGLGLLGAECAEGSQEFVVNCPGIVEEGSNDTLDALDSFICERWAGVLIQEELSSCPIDDGVVSMGGMLWFAWFWVVVFEEDISDIALNGQAASAFVVVPLDVNARKFGT